MARLISIPKDGGTQPIVLGERYFVVKAIDSLAVVSRWGARQGRSLITDTSVSFHRRSGAHKGETFRTIHPTIHSHLGQRTHPLTDATVVEAVPAIMDRVVVTTRLSLLKSDQELVKWEKVISAGALVAVATLAPAALPIAQAATALSDQAVESLSGPGAKRLLEAKLDKNLGSSELTDGYYILFDSGIKHAIRSSDVTIEDGSVYWKASPFKDGSYVAFAVTSFPARGRDAGEGRSWYKLLYWAEEDARATRGKSASARAASLERYLNALDAVKHLFEDDDSYLPKERAAIVQQSSAEITPLLEKPPAAAKGAGGRVPSLPSEAKKVLEVKSQADLVRKVDRYESELRETQEILAADIATDSS